jgi:hypothetical protein
MRQVSLTVALLGLARPQALRVLAERVTDQG